MLLNCHPGRRGGHLPLSWLRRVPHQPLRGLCRLPRRKLQRCRHRPRPRGPREERRPQSAVLSRHGDRLCCPCDRARQVCHRDDLHTQATRLHCRTFHGRAHHSPGRQFNSAKIVWVIFCAIFYLFCSWQEEIEVKLLCLHCSLSSSSSLQAWSA